VAKENALVINNKNEVLNRTLVLITKLDDALTYAYQINSVNSLTVKATQYDKAIKIVDSLVGMSEMMSDTNDFIQASIKIVRLSNDHDGNIKSLEKVNSLIDTAEKINLGKSYLVAVKNDGKKEVLESALTAVKNLGLLTAYMSNLAYITSYQTKINEDQQALTSVEDNIKQIAQSTPKVKVCPTCNRPWEN
jgi:hypothetical protein